MHMPLTHIVVVALALLAAAAGVGLAQEGAGSAGGVVYRGEEGPGVGRHVVLVSGDEEYRSEELLPQIGKILAVRHGFTCTVLFAVDPETGEIDPDVRDNIPGLEALAGADLMIIATRFRDLPDGQMAHIDRYLRSGRPVIGLRTATHAFNIAQGPEGETYAAYSWNAPGGGFGREILGETWIAHHGEHGAESTRGVVAPGAAEHPIARGLEPGSVWGPSDVYTVRLPLPEGCEAVVLGAVLEGMGPDDAPVAGAKNDPMMPIAWVREFPEGSGKPRRVFTTTMGAATDFEASGSRRMLINGVYWALGMEGRIPPEGADARVVGEFAPTPFGFGGYRKGVKPADHAMEAAGTRD